ncbi:hypothetical protein ADU59_06875 [Pararhizobium polonicum]|uniref:Polysaccharide biosynthesis protein n=1 Tax=Pararhizobium polonicum TaxID=1612624 RepID=A0A1C7P490_9HYPH|nr:hypothetical protein [Pararhizobium polonicum]OBZ96088.1 hypothetical protein ADU59_06875 [Pararhizobium polonicum]
MNRFILYLSGRIPALFITFFFQIFLVRHLDMHEYAIVGIVFAFASLTGTLMSAGTQRIIPKYIPAVSFSNLSLRPILAILGGKYAAIAIVLSLCLAAAQGSDLEIAMLIAGSSAWIIAFYCIASCLYLDTEAVSQTLDQQRISRIIALGEPAIRVLIILGLYVLHAPLDSTVVIAVMAATQGIACLVLGANSLRVLIRRRAAERTLPATAPVTALSDVFATGLAGYIAGLAYLATSPAMLRLLVVGAFTTQQLAALIFCQSLVSSLIRYAPGAMIFPLVEARAANYRADSGLIDVQRGGTLFSLLIKLDAILILLVLTIVAPHGELILHILAGDRFAGLGYFLPILLMMPTIAISVAVLQVIASFSGSYRGQNLSALVSVISISAILLFAGRLSAPVIMMIPVADSIVRAAVIYLTIPRENRAFLDLKFLGWTSAISAALLTYAFARSPSLPADLAVQVVLMALIAYVLLFRNALAEPEKRVLHSQIPARLLARIPFASRVLATGGTP